MSQLRIALFVEGSSSPPQARGDPALNRIWNDVLASELNIHPFDSIVPISKKHLVAMDPRSPRMSGSEEPLDCLIARKLEIARRLKQDPFDVAVVAWDLVPAWNPEGEYCRWISYGCGLSRRKNRYWLIFYSGVYFVISILGFIYTEGTQRKSRGGKIRWSSG